MAGGRDDLINVEMKSQYAYFKDKYAYTCIKKAYVVVTVTGAVYEKIAQKWSICFGFVCILESLKI